MPELPEVEVTKQGLLPVLQGQVLKKVICRTKSLREPIDSIAQHLEHKKLLDIIRRSKYLIWVFEDVHSKKGWLLTHLGMSGYWRLWPNPAPQAQKHDHIDLIFEDVTARLTDVRRFGSVRWFSSDPREQAPLNTLGQEPLESSLSHAAFARALRQRHRPVKEVLMSGEVVVGCGNIYCSESLFAAGIDPRRSAHRISEQRCAKLLDSIREVLSAAIAAGGSTLKDFHGTNGEVGYFALHAQVYAREQQPCPKCGHPIRRIVQANRATFFCPKCQK